MLGAVFGHRGIQLFDPTYYWQNRGGIISLRPLESMALDLNG